MNIASTKIELAKRLLATEDKEVINYIKAIFDTQGEDWFESLPDAVQESVKKGLAQAKKGEAVPHADVMTRYDKCRKH